MIQENEIRERTIAYLANSIPAVDLEDWVVTIMRDMHKDSAPNAVRLANAIDDAFIEYSDSCSMTEEALRARLDLITNLPA